MQDDHPPVLALAELEALLEQSDADIKAGRTVPLDTVLAELRESIARMEHFTADRTTNAG